MTCHVPVMTKEVIEQISVEKGGLYVDATFGGGGHSSAILKAGGRVFAIDRDSKVLSILKEFQNDYKDRFAFAIECFSNMDQALQKSRFGDLQPKGVIMDLGMSTLQLEDETRGFAFSRDGVLDMRMGIGSYLSAAEVLNNFSLKGLEKILREYGEEPKAAAIARLIVQRRKKEKFHTTGQLSRICNKVWPFFRQKHPATLTFQAIRIFVNREMDELEQGLMQVEKLLKKGGGAVLISFHSLEDRLIKSFFKNSNVMKAVGKVILASRSEIALNPRARSAKMRCAVKA